MDIHAILVLIMLSSFLSRGLIVPSKEKKKERRSRLMRKLARAKGENATSSTGHVSGMIGLLETMRAQLEAGFFFFALIETFCCLLIIIFYSLYFCYILQTIIAFNITIKNRIIFFVSLSLFLVIGPFGTLLLFKFVCHLWALFSGRIGLTRPRKNKNCNSIQH